MDRQARHPTDPSLGALDWENLEERPKTHQAPRDALGLTPEDRLALGLTGESLTLAHTSGDATQALREAISSGAIHNITRIEAEAIRKGAAFHRR